MSDDQVITEALQILSRRLKNPGVSLGSPDAVKTFLTLTLAREEREIFAVLFLDVKNRLIAFDPMFHGTLTHTSVYPREVVKTSLAHNAASVIFSHNHPSGTPEPSQSDITLTSVLKQALALVDVRVLDHVIVGGDKTFSFAEHGTI